MKKVIIGILIVILCGLIWFMVADWDKLKEKSNRFGPEAGIENLLHFKEHVDYFNNAISEVKTDLGKGNMNGALNVFYNVQKKQKEEFSDYGYNSEEKIKLLIADGYLEENNEVEAKAFVKKYGLEKFSEVQQLEDAYNPNRADMATFEGNCSIYESEKTDLNKAKVSMAQGKYLEAYQYLKSADEDPEVYKQFKIKDPTPMYFAKEVKSEESICVDKLMPMYETEIERDANFGMFKKANMELRAKMEPLVSSNDSRVALMKNYIKVLEREVKVSYSDSLNILEKSDSSIDGNVIFSNVQNGYEVYSHPTGAVNFVTQVEGGLLNGKQGYLFSIKNMTAFEGTFSICNKEYYAFVDNQSGNVSYYTGKVNFTQNYPTISFGGNINNSDRSYFTSSLAKGMLINYLSQKKAIKENEIANLRTVYGNNFKELKNEPYEEIAFKGVNYVITQKEIYKVENGSLVGIDSQKEAVEN